MLLKYFKLKYFHFCLDLFRHVEKRLDKEFMTSQGGQEVITIHTLSNISRSKGNQTTKFCQLIEYKIKNNFLGKSCTKFSGEASSRPFYKKSNLSISLDQQSEMLQSLFILYI